MSQANPFQQTMVRMQLPAGHGASISMRGFEVQADSDRCVTVPKEFTPELEAHGLTKAADAAPVKK